jgi:hypothetical protein
MESTQQKFAAHNFNHVFHHVHYSYAYVLQQLKLHTLRARGYHFDALFLYQAYIGSKFSSSLLKSASVRVSARCVRDFALLNICSRKDSFLVVLPQHLMLFVGTLTYLEPKHFIIIVFYNDAFNY